MHPARSRSKAQLQRADCAIITKIDVFGRVRRRQSLGRSSSRLKKQRERSLFKCQELARRWRCGFTSTASKRLVRYSIRAVWLDAALSGAACPKSAPCALRRHRWRAACTQHRPIRYRRRTPNDTRCPRVARCADPRALRGLPLSPWRSARRAWFAFSLQRAAPAPGCHGERALGSRVAPAAATGVEPGPLRTRPSNPRRRLPPPP